MACPLCPSDMPAVWKYNMCAHIENFHPRAAATDYLHLYHLSEAEEYGMKQAWNGRFHAKRASDKKKSTKSTLSVSDAHVAQLAQKFVCSSE